MFVFKRHINTIIRNQNRVIRRVTIGRIILRIRFFTHRTSSGKPIKRVHVFALITVQRVNVLIDFLTIMVGTACYCCWVSCNFSSKNSLRRRRCSGSRSNVTVRVANKIVVLWLHSLRFNLTTRNILSLLNCFIQLKPQFGGFFVFFRNIQFTMKRTDDVKVPEFKPNNRGTCFCFFT